MSDDKRGMTLWEIAREALKKNQEKPPEFKLFNPLKAKLGDFVSIEAEGVSGINFTVFEIAVYKRIIHGESFEFTEYILRDGDKWVTVRVNPIADPDQFSKKHYDVLMLSPDYEMDYDGGLHNQILNAGLPLEVKDDKDEILATYCRLVEGMRDPYHCEVTVLKDKDKPPSIESIDYWDFGRHLGDGTCEFYFVELNNTHGHMFQMFKGVEISEKDITIFSGNQSKT